MYKIIIADDEKMTRDSLKEYIPWNELGIDTVETAKNGLAAMELVRELKPDIIITDIRMPKMDGIEFASKARELLPDVKIIFLSGYSDKEYLKSAIHLKAVNYIEKPVNLREVQAIVHSAVDLCREDEARRAEKEKLKNSLAESIPLICQKIAEALAKGASDPDTLKDKYDHPLLHQPPDSLFMAACAIINWNASTEEEIRDGIRRNITDILSGYALGNGMTLIGGFLGDERIILISAGSMDDLLSAFFNKLLELSENRFTVSIGMGSPVKGLKLLQQSYSEAAITADKQFYSGVNRIYQPGLGSGLKNHYTMNKNLYMEFKDLLKKGNKKAAMELVGKVTEKIASLQDPDTDHVKNIYFNLLLRIFEAARERELIDSAVESENTYIWQEIDGIRTLAELSEYICSNMNAILIRKESKDEVGRKTKEIIQYIREHYADKNLSVRMIADHTYLSQTYLCSFFKKSTGKTLNEFITEVRMDKARDLLRENRVKLYEIASNLGYSDTNYFSTLFKKYAGCTPSEFREKNYR